MYKQKEIAISIIVPVYNTSNYLDKCLDSIINQSYKNFEVICIDDGSQDDSYSILEKYSEKINDFKIISQLNSGVAVARNKGLALAKGKYIVFIDSDDFIKPNYLEALYSEAIKSNSDIVMCNYYRYFEKNHLCLPIIYKKRSGVYTSSEILKAIIPDNLIHSYLWNKLWKKDLFNNIYFPNMKFEDLAIMCSLIYNSNKVSIIDDKLYYYRIRSTSIVRSYSTITQNDYIKAYGYIRLCLKDNNEYNKYTKYFTFLSIKVFIVMLFANLILTRQNKSLKLTYKNIKSCNKFIFNANSNCFSYDKESLKVLKLLE